MPEALSPQQIVKEAQAAYRRGDYAAAAQSYEAARQSYLLAGDEVMAAEMSNNVSVALLQDGNPEGSLQAVEGTAAIFAAAGDQKRQAMALGNQAAALEDLNRVDEAEQLYWQAAEILKNINETDLRLSVMQSISALQLRTGRQMQAVATMQAGVAGIEKPSLTQRLLKTLLNLPTKMMGDGS
jgi:tetratricopeptide (TPR) repeat protein